MTSFCGTYSGYQRATRYRRIGQGHCGPCEKCLMAARVYYKQPRFKERRARKFRERRAADDGGFRLREHAKQQRKAYGIGLTQKEAIFAAQGSCCAVCRRLTPGSSRGWFTDHNHTTGDVRGVVCINCNSLLGHACKAVGSEDPADLSEYLGARVLRYLREGAVLVRDILAAVPLESMAAPSAKLTPRQLDVLRWLDVSTFKRAAEYSGPKCGDTLLRFVALGLAERQSQSTRTGNYRLTSAGQETLRSMNSSGEP